MTLWFLSVGGALLIPVLSAVDGDVLLRALDVGLSVGLGAFFLRLLLKGDLRRAAEVEAADLRVAAADKRTAVAEARAEREAENRQRMQDKLSTDLMPEMVKFSVQAERMIEANTRIAELMEEVVRAFLREIKRT